MPTNTFPPQCLWVSVGEPGNLILFGEAPCRRRPGEVVCESVPHSPQSGPGWSPFPEPQPLLASQDLRPPRTPHRTSEHHSAPSPLFPYSAFSSPVRFERYRSGRSVQNGSNGVSSPAEFSHLRRPGELSQFGFPNWGLNIWVTVQEAVVEGILRKGKQEHPWQEGGGPASFKSVWVPVGRAHYRQAHSGALVSE